MEVGYPLCILCAELKLIVAITGKMLKALMLQLARVRMATFASQDQCCVDLHVCLIVQQGVICAARGNSNVNANQMLIVLSKMLMPLC